MMTTMIYLRGIGTGRVSPGSATAYPATDRQTHNKPFLLVFSIWHWKTTTAATTTFNVVLYTLALGRKHLHSFK